MTTFKEVMNAVKEYESGGIKQVIAVDASLKMRKGKTAAQVAHASLKAALQVLYLTPIVYSLWDESGYKKVVVRANSREEMDELKREACKHSIPNYLVIDQGLTQIPLGSKTAIAIGPWYDEEVDKITGHLPLLQ